MLILKLYMIIGKLFSEVCLGREFRLGMLSPFQHPRLGWTNNAAAATIAIETAQSQGILANHNITVKWRDDKCSSLGGAGNTVLLRDEDDVDVLIGPPCSSATEPAGLLASFWNMPIFSQASTDPALADKSTYTTLVRLGPPFNKLGNALVETFKYYKWNRVVQISRRRTDNRNVFCDYSSRSTDAAFRTNNITVADWMVIDDGISDIDIENILQRVKERGRIIILCSENVDDRRRILLKARQLGMMGSDYVYFLPDHLPPADVETPWVRGDSFDEEAKSAFSRVFQITVAEMASPDVEAFRDSIPTKMAEYPWNYNNSGTKGSLYSPFLHDAVYLYLLCLNETITEGGNHRNGSLMFNKAKGKQFRGITGNVKVDSNGDREPDYWIWNMQRGESKFQVATEIRMTSSVQQKIFAIKPILWDTADGLPPPDTPVCGYFGEKCIEQKDHTTYIVIGFLLGFALVVTAVIGFMFYRRTKYEKQLDLMLWKIKYEDIRLTKSRAIGSISQLSLHASNSTTQTAKSLSEQGQDQIFARVGTCNDNVVTIHTLATGGISLQRNNLKELKAMRDLQHENVNQFIGMCDDNRLPCILTMYCSKGSFQDILENDDIKLDWIFKVSLIADLINGMVYIHNSPLKYHGNLKSSNCVVDNRWVLKVTDYGLQTIRHTSRPHQLTEYQQNRELFWTSPENIRDPPMCKASSQKGDVYSFAVILFETLYRSQPYDTNLYSPNEIIQRVKSNENPPFRPKADYKCDSGVHQNGDKKGVDGTLAIMKLMHECWVQFPSDRPTFVMCKQHISKLGRRVNIVDNMVTMLEKYANNLEDLVEQRTQDLMHEKKKTDALLYRMLPATVADRLKVGEVVMPEIFDSVTIFFSDIVGFTALASMSTAMEIVDFLNDLYTSFDSIIAKFEVYKVETIGDAYMVVSGLPIPNGSKHSSEIADMALELLSSVCTFKIKHQPNTRLKLRIGIHSGSCAAGVVGRTMPRYCLFGDTVNTASRMESNGEAFKIHLSQAAYTALSKHDGYNMVERGEMDIKGKGIQKTYWLTGKQNTKLKLPSQASLLELSL